MTFTLLNFAKPHRPRLLQNSYGLMSNGIAIVLAINEENQIALIRQAYVSTTNYVCIAGYIKAGESAEDTAIREVNEEIGIKAECAGYVKSYYYEKHDNLMLGFMCRVKKAEFKLSCEVDTVKWFSLEQARGMLREGSIAAALLEDYLKGEGKNKDNDCSD